MRILITGANGFIARNLSIQLKEMDGIEVLEFSRKNSKEELVEMCSKADAVVHLAGINRPLKEEEFAEGNYHLTEEICDALSSTERKIPIIFTSSIQAALDNPYGTSKLAAENSIDLYSKTTGSEVFIYRLPNVFGKWCRPNYNSVVATFCNNIALNLPIEINDPNYEINLVYIDDVVNDFISILLGQKKSCALDDVTTYSITLGELAEQIMGFRNSRELLTIGHVGLGLVRALYATYLSYLKPEMFTYDLTTYKDERGVFGEMLKTKDSGQFSFFTSKPGVTRGEHYHHTKNEKFLVISGKARFRFRNILTNEEYSVDTGSEKPQVVETVPGWAHDITNIGDEEMMVMLWANEIFDRDNSDTYPYRIQ